jgi:hypothetical protein
MQFLSSINYVEINSGKIVLENKFIQLMMCITRGHSIIVPYFINNVKIKFMIITSYKFFESLKKNMLVLI